MTEQKKKSLFNQMKWLLVLAIVVMVGYKFGRSYLGFLYENRVLKEMVRRLETDSRVAEVLVTHVEFNPVTQKNMTTIKFLEYDSLGGPLEPRYFTFSGNVIQFQSLVIRFEDELIRNAHSLKGKSAYIFWKAFVLDGAQTEEYIITSIDEVPEGYETGMPLNDFEEELWHNFWDYALNSSHRKNVGIKNAQIEAPGTKFMTGLLYTLKIEHDGGLRIDVKDIPAILKGETIYQ